MTQRHTMMNSPGGPGGQPPFHTHTPKHRNGPLVQHKLLPKAHDIASEAATIPSPTGEKDQNKKNANDFDNFNCMSKQQHNNLSIILRFYTFSKFLHMCRGNESSLQIYMGVGRIFIMGAGREATTSSLYYCRKKLDVFDAYNNTLIYK